MSLNTSRDINCVEVLQWCVQVLSDIWAFSWLNKSSNSDEHLLIYTDRIKRLSVMGCPWTHHKNIFEQNCSVVAFKCCRRFDDLLTQSNHSDEH